MNIIQEITVDLVYPNTYDYARANQYNKGTWYLLVNLTDRGDMFTIPTNTKAIISGLKPDGKFIFNNEITIENNQLYIPLTEQMLAVAGKFVARLELYLSEKELTYDDYGFPVENSEDYVFLSSVNFTILISPAPFDRDKITSTDEYNELTTALYEIQISKEKAIAASELADETSDQLKIIQDALATLIQDATSLSGARIDDSTPSLSRVYSSKYSEDIFVKKNGDKVLTDNNFTNAEKIKLARIEDDANNYIHPLSHSAEMIIETTNKQFVTSADKINYADKYTKDEVDNFISGVLNSTVYKEAVNTYDDILVVYPNPKEGWTVATDEGTYRFDGKIWVKIANAASIPIATSNTSGLMSSDMVTKLSGITKNAQVNVIEQIQVDGEIISVNSNKSVNLKLSDKFIPVTSGYSLMSNDEHTKLDSVEENAQVNKIEKLYLNGTELVVNPANKSVTIDLASDGTGLTATQLKTLNSIGYNVDLNNGNTVVSIGNLKSTTTTTGVNSITIDGLLIDSNTDNTGSIINTFGGLSTTLAPDNDAQLSLGNLTISKQSASSGIGTSSTTVIGDMKSLITTTSQGTSASILVGDVTVAQIVSNEIKNDYSINDFDIFFNTLVF